MTKQEAVLKYLKTHKKGLTSMEAIDKFGDTRLSGTIGSLRKQGHNIVTEYSKVKTRYGKTTLIGTYKLV